MGARRSQRAGLEESMKRSHRSRGLPLLVGIASLSLAGLTAPRAWAGEWHCEILDGPGSTYPGADTSAHIEGATAAILWNGEVLPFYTDGNSLSVRYGISSTSPSAPSWQLHTLATPNDFEVGALNAGGTIWTAYSPGDDDYLDVGFSSSGPVAGSPVYTGPGLMEGTPSLASYAGATWIFYGTGIYDSETSSHDEVDYVVAFSDGSSIGPFTLDGGPGNDMGSPVAVVVGSSLQVFYYETTGYLLRKTYNGWSWGAAETVDGDGGIPGQTWDYVGNFASAIVDTYPSPNVLHVFYYDSTMQSLRTASQTVGGTNWSYAIVDGGVPGPGQMGMSSAPVLQSNTTQVYYTDDTHHTIRGATLNAGVWTWQAIIDGGTSGSLCASQGGGATTHGVSGTLAAVKWGGGPHLFYGDESTGALRHAGYY
jgi:hypothetical protein